jgi:hypothetical protein
LVERRGVMTHTRLCLNPLLLLLLLGLVPLYGIDCGGGDDGGTGGDTGPPTVTCANFNQQNVDFLQCGFDEATEVCRFYIKFFDDQDVEKSCGEHCEDVVGGTCISSVNEESTSGPGRCQESGLTEDCAEDWNSAICSCTLNTGGTAPTD